MVLEIKNATLGYRNKAVLQGIDLRLHTGETTCVIGRNGAGKTTLFKSLLGLLPLLCGEILLNGKNAGRWNRKQFAQAVAYVPQVRALPFPYSVFEVVLFGRTAHLSCFASPSKKDKTIAEECLEKLHISHLKDRSFTQLSGGEQQMVIIARALAQQPAFLIMDEPTASLDFGNQIEITNQVNSLRSEQLGIVMATHSPEHALMCDADVAVLHQGRLWKQMISDELLTEIYGVDVENYRKCLQKCSVEERVLSLSA